MPPTTPNPLSTILGTYICRLKFIFFVAAAFVIDFASVYLCYSVMLIFIIAYILIITIICSVCYIALWWSIVFTMLIISLLYWNTKLLIFNITTYVHIYILYYVLFLTMLISLWNFLSWYICVHTHTYINICKCKFIAR